MGLLRNTDPLPKGIVLVLTIVLCKLLLNWVSFRFKMFEHLLSRPPLRLIGNGQMNRRNMRQEYN
jgi:uncharacterized membrane protein YcaP (DUF421 family)